jgi:phosphohistidine phosphatase SixA
MRGLRWIAAIFLGIAFAATAAEDPAWRALTGPVVLLVRHAETDPGVGDPPNFRLEDCATQRNLSSQGRASATSIGKVLRARGVRVAAVESSQWCRCLHTARLAFPQLEVVPSPVLNSFFDDRSRAPAQTDALRERISRWRGPGVLVLVTHHVNIAALTGEGVAAGEGVVLLPAGLTVVGRLRFQE